MSKIILRRDSADDWSNANPTLDTGEVGIETDTGKIKIGDNSTAWNDLSYATKTIDEINNDLGNKQDILSEGAFIDGDKDKLDGIENNATADQTASEIKTAYESNSNTNAYIDDDKNKLAGIESNAEVNVQSDYNETDDTKDDYIKNKPDLSIYIENTAVSSAPANPNNGQVYLDDGTNSAAGLETMFQYIDNGWQDTNPNVVLDVTGSFDIPGNSGWRQIPLDNIVTDTSNSWDATNHKFVTPVKGIYVAYGHLRPHDVGQDGGMVHDTSFGIGINDSIQDGAWFSWFFGAPKRHHAINFRVWQMDAGTDVNLFTYMDTSDEIKGTASMQLFLLRQLS